MSPKKDRVLNLLLLACFKARDLLLRVKHDLPRNETAASNSDVTLALFREVTRSALQGLMEQDAKTAPGLSVDVILSSSQHMNVVDRFFHSAVRGDGDDVPQNIGCVSVIGSMASQEVIKAITHVHTPVSQFQMFEALDSTSTVDESQSSVDMDGLSNQSSGVDTEASTDLSSLKIFVVGAGAIGCEVLKNFALMGVGAGNLTEINNNSSSMWSRHGLQNGGIIVADMDSIERSNLNRQLLFR